MINFFEQNKILFIIIASAIIVGGTLFYYSDTFFKSPNTEKILEANALTLDIPEGALSEGVSEDQIVVRSMPVSELPESVRNDFEIAYAFNLAPDGIEFLKPIQFTLRVPDRDGAIPILRHIYGDTIEILNNTSMVFNSDTSITITSSVSHFSNIAVSYDKEIRVSMPADMGSFWVGESFSVPVTIIITGTDEDGADKKVLYQPDYKHTTGLPNSIDRSFITYGPIKPDYVENKPESTIITSASSPLSVSADFTCIEAGEGTIHYVGSLTPHNSNDPSITSLDIETRVECLGSKVISWDIETKCGGIAKIEAVLDDLSEVEKVFFILKGFGGSNLGVKKSSFDKFTKTLYATITLPPEVYYAEIWVTSEREVDYRAGSKEFIIEPCEESVIVPYQSDPCLFDEYIECRDSKFDLQGCIDECPYVSVICSEVGMAGDECLITDEVCSNTCLDRGEAVAKECASKARCTMNEIDAKLRELYPEPNI